MIYGHTFTFSLRSLALLPLPAAAPRFPPISIRLPISGVFAATTQTLRAVWNIGH